MWLKPSWPILINNILILPCPPSFILFPTQFLCVLFLSACVLLPYYSFTSFQSPSSPFLLPSSSTRLLYLIRHITPPKRLALPRALPDAGVRSFRGMRTPVPWADVIERKCFYDIGLSARPLEGCSRSNRISLDVVMGLFKVLPLLLQRVCEASVTSRVSGDTLPFEVWKSSSKLH